MSSPTKRAKTESSIEDVNWQTTRSTVLDRNHSMFNNTLLSDVEFSVVNREGHTISIPAHKYVLAISSPVFEAMFYGKLPETSRTITIPDCTAEGLLELLRYLYRDEIELDGVVMEVLYLAKKYFLPLLHDKCIDYVKTTVGPDDVFNVLPQTVKHGDDKLTNVCWSIVDFQTQAAVTSLPFLDVTQEMLCDILDRSSLNVTELELFLAVDRWAVNKICEQELPRTGESKREVIGETALHLIRFPLLTMEEIEMHVLPKEILEKDEIVDIVTYLGPGSMTEPKIFNKDKRGIYHYEICKRFRVFESPHSVCYCRYTKKDTCIAECRNVEVNAVNTISFTVSTQVHLAGVRLFGDEGKEYRVWLNIYQATATKKTMRMKYPLHMQEMQKFTTDDEMSDGYYGFTVKLDKPVYLQPNSEYTVEAIVDGPRSYLGLQPKKSVRNNNVEFKFLGRPIEEYDGQIPELYYLVL